MCIPNTLAFRRKLEDSALLLRVNLSICSRLAFYGGGSEVADKFSFTIYSARAAEVFFFRLIHRSSQRSLLLSLGWNFPLLSSVEFLQDMLVPKGLFFSWGSEILRWTAPRLWEIPWEVFSLTSCFVIHLQRRCLGLFFLLYYGLTLVKVFPIHYVEEEIIKKKWYDK